MEHGGQRWPRLKNSVQIRLALLAAFALFPMLILLVINNLYSMELERSKLSQSNRNTITLYANQIDTALHGVERYAASLYTHDEDISIMLRSTQVNQKKLASWRLMMLFDEAINLHSSVDCLYILPLTGDDLLLRRRANQLEFSIPELTTIVRELPNMPAWHWYLLDGRYYLVRAFLLGDYYVGAFVSADTLLALSKDLDFQGLDRLFITTQSGLPLADNLPGFEQQFQPNLLLHTYQPYVREDSKYIAIGTEISNGNYILATTASDEGLFGSLSNLQKGITILICCFALYIPVLFVMVKRRIIKPLEMTVTAMKELREGDLDVQIPDTKCYDEFQMVHTTFNSMASDLKQSKIDIYEERLKRKETMLQFLQLQLSPHFLVNGLNSVHTMIDSGNLSLSKQMVQHLAKHLQYAMQTSPFVTLGEELDFLQNYLNIQSLRYNNRIIPVIQCEEGLEAIAVPPLVLQTFLENSLKYAFNKDNTVIFMLSIKKEHVPDQELDFLSIHISDTGKGFPEQTIRLFESDKRIVDKKGEHFGIRNIRDRLTMLYHADASIQLSNQPKGGAHISIRIPAKTMGDIFRAQ